jgi:hypothetical protein
MTTVINHLADEVPNKKLPWEKPMLQVDLLREFVQTGKPGYNFQEQLIQLGSFAFSLGPNYIS